MLKALLVNTNTNASLSRHTSHIAMVQNSSHDYDIAIVGGGIAGATLAVGLVRNNIPVTLYESAKAFGEIGAGIALTTNAVRAMELLAPDVKRGFDRVGTFNLSTAKKNVWFDFRKGVGTKGDNADDGAGELITSVETPAGSAYVHRAHFLDEMVKLIPEGVAKFDKRLQDIETLPDGNVKLKFVDGTEAVHSAVVGCDGVKSRTRKVVLGENDPAASAVFSGKYAYRGLIPMHKAAELLGDEVARNSQMYFGYHGHVLTFPIQHGDIMNVVAFASKDEWKDPNWVVNTTKEDLAKDFAGFSKNVRDIISMMQNTDIWALFEHLPSHTYTRDRMLVIGDAAHATTPHHGSGAAMAIEDAFVLSSLLTDVHHASDLKAAFQAFEKVRLYRTQKLVATSHEAGKLYDFELPDHEDDVEKIRVNLQKRMRWIWEEDLEQEVVDAKTFFKTAAKEKY
ncbi:hypothetical protein BBO99_00008943 [Phytophthora kernoviae]|uniref:FAD-binding domain-containing protein n=2 Tax=Phytophthora kernoviae TaxID=325452 RepID=A0A3R7JP80_9STRA|nr:hypothetical protein G195_010211 [Phytophthora kernoviae 00238/432]KAG2502754.1 hypothetical protein JM16_009593 [Phytophthora kernoviae]KAG2509798.1 hypothetical protein JM18_008195 [Phytophthora kernoviae]RLN20811.1 hypothetical protein BBI17_008962 [Phytophthora kernoviae]RLN74422.1 hypothetical protein BBO99_00008943 [Phytophthora kernoviae]